MRTGLHIQHPSHLIGKLVEVSMGRESVFNLTGVDWPTRDGSGIRDYIHVWDLALAHLKAVENFDKAISEGSEDGVDYTVINLGTGQGVTVKEFLAAFENVVGKKIACLDSTPPTPGRCRRCFCQRRPRLEAFGMESRKEHRRRHQRTLSSG